MNRLLIYHKNITTFDELTKFCVKHPSNLRNWSSCVYISEVNTIDSGDYFFLLLIEWLCAQQSYVKQDKNGRFIVKNEITKKDAYYLIEYALLFGLFSSEQEVCKNNENYIFTLRKNWSTIYDTFCKLNLDSNFLNINSGSNSFILLKID